MNIFSNYKCYEIKIRDVNQICQWDEEKYQISLYFDRPLVKENKEDMRNELSTICGFKINKVYIDFINGIHIFVHDKDTAKNLSVILKLVIL